MCRRTSGRILNTERQVSNRQNEIVCADVNTIANEDLKGYTACSTDYDDDTPHAPVPDYRDGLILQFQQSYYELERARLDLIRAKIWLEAAEKKHRLISSALADL